MLTQVSRVLLKAVKGENSDGNLSVDENLLTSFDNAEASMHFQSIVKNEQIPEINE